MSTREKNVAALDKEVCIREFPGTRASIILSAPLNNNIVLDKNCIKSFFAAKLEQTYFIDQKIIETC